MLFKYVAVSRYICVCIPAHSTSPVCRTKLVVASRVSIVLLKGHLSVGGCCADCQPAAAVPEVLRVLQSGVQDHHAPRRARPPRGAAVLDVPPPQRVGQPSPRPPVHRPSRQSPGNGLALFVFVCLFCSVCLCFFQTSWFSMTDVLVRIDPLSL